MPSNHSVMPSMPDQFNDGGMGRDLMIGQSTGSEMGGFAASFEKAEEIVIYRDGNDIWSKRPRGFNLFTINRPSSSGAGPSRNLSFYLDIDVNRFDPSKAEGPSALHNPSARDSMRASSVIAMDTIHSVEENSMESVEYHPCDVDDVHKPSSARRSGGMSEALDLNCSNQAQEGSFV
ncbi:hypothetical protein GUJ93_ZPchr0013g35838 [Zizania palustris]|uniref:Uncharacterized protein n=1 Tax=Zizania palustris TaxID=103762 RepID=A0A8J5WZ32_ZIZPA|nr:hypothetical protein GUJ93_ZPchr0013g35838 [Zizania palustris]